MPPPSLPPPLANCPPALLPLRYFSIIHAASLLASVWYAAGAIKSEEEEKEALLFFSSESLLHQFKKGEEEGGRHWERKNLPLPSSQSFISVRRRTATRRPPVIPRGAPMGGRGGRRKWRSTVKASWPTLQLPNSTKEPSQKSPKFALLSGGVQKMCSETEGSFWTPVSAR